MHASASQMLVARRYLERGFLDSAMRLFVRNAAAATAGDWTALAEALLDRQRLTDVVRVCAVGGIPLPRARILALGDARLRRRDLDGARQLYELAGADGERWASLVDALTASPDLERLAIEVAARYLAPAAARPSATAVGA